MINVVYLSFKPNVPPDDYWDLGMLKSLFNRQMWSPVLGHEFKEHTSPDTLPKDTDGAVVVFPARNQVECLAQLNAFLKSLKWVVLILVGDEANEFPAEQVSHPNMKLWIMSPNPEKHGDEVRKIGTGYPPQALTLLPNYEKDYLKKPLDYYFAGQITHERRQELKEVLETLDEFKHAHGMKGKYNFSERFTEGVSHEEYFKNLAGAKCAPAPSGPENPDSFRLFEALEAGSIPIADAYSPKLKHPDYWTYFFGEQPPFPVITNYADLNGYIQDAAENFIPMGNKVFAWWQRYKRRFAYWLEKDINNLRLTEAEPQQGNMRDFITVIMPSSPILDHPSTEMIEQTIKDIRIHLPNSEILITVDGVRAEQQTYKDNYEEYKRRLLWKANHEWSNVLPIIFEKHSHQATMAREVLKLVKTPTILYVEHDTPLVPDRPYDWKGLTRNILDGTANIIRFSHESKIIEEHKHLVLSDPEVKHGVRMIKTSQWSQRPHLASTAFYKHMLNTYFHPESLTMIEDVIHQIVEIDMRQAGKQAWFNWRIWMYAPEDPDGSILRSYNLDGRKSDPKYEMIIKPVEHKNG